MKRIIMHWTAGSHKASSLDREHYHYLIQGDGTVVQGVSPVSANAAPLSKNYAVHTANLNTDSIGVAVCAMRGANQVPFRAGDQPITTAQIDKLVELTAMLARQYKIPVTRQTILSHGEVQPTLGVKQAGKWDIAWLPGRSSATDPIGVGDYLRSRVTAELEPTPAPNTPPTQTTASGGLLGWVLAGAVATIIALKAAFGG